MKRTQRKCLIASAVTHALLLAMVLIASAFVPQRKPEEIVSFTLITIPDILVDTPNVVGGGGTPNARLPEPEPVSQPPVEPPRPVPVQPRPEPIVQPRPEPVRPEPPSEPKRPEPEVVRKPESKPEPKSTFDLSKAVHKTVTPKAAATPAPDNRAQERERQLASAADQFRSRLQNEFGRETGPIGIPGPGGPAYASYNLALVKYYEERWVTPRTYTENEPVVATEITIRGDGTVLSWRITKKANRRELDKSVETTLDRVKKVPPFPSGDRNETRTFKINFNLSSKLNL